MFLELQAAKCGVSNSKFICSFCLLYKVLDVLPLDVDKEKIDNLTQVIMNLLLIWMLFWLSFTQL